MPSNPLSDTPDLHVSTALLFGVWESSVSTDLIYLFNVVLFQKVTFQRHLVNTNDDFNLGLGIFTARVAGVYYFNFHSMSKVDHRSLHTRHFTSATASDVSYTVAGLFLLIGVFLCSGEHVSGDWCQ